MPLAGAKKLLDAATAFSAIVIGSWPSAEFDAYTSVYGGTGTFSAVSGGDGSMSESEYITYAKSASGTPSCAWRLSKYDANNNNQWSQTEFDAYIRDYGGSAVFSDVDASQGGIISSSEWNSYCASSDSFAQYDTDGDCRWSCTEFDAYNNAVSGRGGGCRGARGPISRGFGTSPHSFPQPTITRKAQTNRRGRARPTSTGGPFDANGIFAFSRVLWPSDARLAAAARPRCGRKTGAKRARSGRR